jgi:hypothetical protein
MSKATLRGPQAVIRWGYQPAVILGPWSVENEAGRRVLTASVITTDQLRVSQQPLTFIVSRPSGQMWRWPVETLQIAGTQLTASLGPQE